MPQQRGCQRVRVGDQSFAKREDRSIPTVENGRCGPLARCPVMRCVVWHWTLHSSPPMTILAVDDDHTSLALIEQAMRSDGHVLHSYESARVALEQLQNHRIVPDLILSDVRMPELDGAGFFREVRRLLPAIPFMYLTVVDDLEEVVALVRRGATDLVHKPINPGDLRMRVRCAMDEVERRQAVEQALRERELEKAEEHRMLSWKALYASKETRQVRGYRSS